MNVWIIILPSCHTSGAYIHQDRELTISEFSIIFHITFEAMCLSNIPSHASEKQRPMVDAKHPLLSAAIYLNMKY